MNLPPTVSTQSVFSQDLPTMAYTLWAQIPLSTVLPKLLVTNYRSAPTPWLIATSSDTTILITHDSRSALHETPPFCNSLHVSSLKSGTVPFMRLCELKVTKCQRWDNLKEQNPFIWIFEVMRKGGWGGTILTNNRNSEQRARSGPLWLSYRISPATL